MFEIPTLSFKNKSLYFISSKNINYFKYKQNLRTVLGMSTPGPLYSGLSKLSVRRLQCTEMKVMMIALLCHSSVLQKLFSRNASLMERSGCLLYWSQQGGSEMGRATMEQWETHLKVPRAVSPSMKEAQTLKRRFPFSSKSLPLRAQCKSSARGSRAAL